MKLEKALARAKKLAQVSANKAVCSYVVWFDDDYNEYRIATDSELEAMIDRCFIWPNDIIAEFYC